MVSGEKQVINFGSEDNQEVAVQPRAQLIIDGVDFDAISVDIIDADIVLTNDGNGDIVVLTGLAILLFDEDQAPSISINGTPVSPSLLLSKVGEIQNLTAQEFVAVSSLLEDNLKPRETEDESEDESENDAQADTEVLQAIVSAIEAINQAQAAEAEQTEVAEDEGKFDRNAVDEEGDTFLDATLASSKSQSASSISSEESAEVLEAEILFELYLLQPASSEELETIDGVDFRQVLGGGGSEESAFNSENEAQYSTEVLNYGTASDDLTIYTDNPAFFDENTITRVIEMSPTFPAGFTVTLVTLTGFPDGFAIDGATQVGDTWTVESPELDERGSFQVNLIYSVPSDETFTVDFSVTAEFQEGSLDSDGVALAVPTETTQVSEDSRIFQVNDVFSANDLNYTNTDGDEVWVLANDPNATRVFSGSGDDEIIGAAGIDYIQGGDGDDTIDGGLGDDELNGEAGDDTLLYGEGADQYTGGSGTDTLDYSELNVAVIADLSVEIDGFAQVIVDPDGQETTTDEVTTVENITTGTGDDTLTGDTQNNVLRSGGGNDTLTGGGGNDVLDGGDDVDVVDYSTSLGAISADLSLTENNVYIDDSNIDTLISIEEIIATEFDDDLIGSTADDVFFGGAGNDFLAGGEGSDTLDGGDGEHDVADFSSADSGVIVDLGGTSDADGYVFATQGTDANRLKDIEDLIGSDQADQLSGNSLDQIITGGGGDDIIDGAGGADTLDGGLGQDSVSGGAGDDIFVHSDGIDQLDGGSDQDTIDFSLSDSVTQIDAALDGETQTLISVSGGDDIFVQNIENVTGTTGDDRIEGDSNDNILDGGAGDDILIGAAGDDSLIGGEGLDSADYSVATVAVNIDLSEGSVTNDGFGGVDSIDGIENLTGSDFSDTLAGDAQDNVISGGAGNDVLIGRGGDDLLSGGEGLDTASYESAGAAVTVDLAATELTNDGEGGEDTFDSIESVTGSAFNDTLFGDEGGNTLSGLAGDDYLDGRAGDDLLSGGSGNDTLIAGGGADSHDGGIGTDTLDYSGYSAADSIRVTLQGSEYAQVSVTGADDDQVRNVESVVATAGNDQLGGDSQANSLSGEGGDDVISGGTGSDQLLGGEGDDQLRFDDLLEVGVTLSLITNTASYAVDGSVDSFSGFETYATTLQDDIILTSIEADSVEGLDGDDSFISSSGSDTLHGGAGQDTVDYSDNDDIDHIEARLDEGNTITIDVIGGDDDEVTSIESVIGSPGDDLLYGDTQDNTLEGAAGNDVLDGGAGDDHLLGDAGDDRFVAGLGEDIFEGGAGTDELDFSGAASSVSVDLSLNAALNDGSGGQDTILTIENIIGSSGSDIIAGDSRVNVLSAGAGNDIVRGGLGSDTLDGGAGQLDEVHFDDLSDFGITLDIEAGTATYRQDASTDTLLGFELYFTTNQDDLITGSEADDTVSALDGNDIIYASAGADFLDGGAGSDSVDYSTVVEASSVSVTLNGASTAIATLVGVGSQSIVNIENVTGTSGNDTLGGDSLENTIVAGDGDDTVFGGAGSDVLDGGDGLDELRFDELSAVGITLDLSDGTGTASYAPDSSVDTFTRFERYVTTNQDDTVVTTDSSDEVYTLAGNDSITASVGADTLDGGLGVDSVDYSALVGVSDIEVALASSIPVTVSVNGADNQTISNIENVTGTDGNDTISGDDQQNTLEGLAGSDTLSGEADDDNLLGGAGNDVLRGGAGNDLLDGEQGQDTADYSDATGGVAVDLTAGEASNDGLGGADTLESIENVIGGAFSDVLAGNDSANVIDSGDGDDTVYGAMGSDTLSGGDHTSGDVLRFDDLDDVGIALNIDTGIASYGGDLSVDTFSGFEEYVGTQQADTIIGSAAIDIVSTLGGDDELSASAGRDILDGGAGADTLDYSGLGNIGGIELNLDGSSDTTVTVIDGDDDTIANIENIVASSGDDVLGGDAFANRLEGLDGDDQFDASAGADTLIGGAGDDTLDYSALSSATSISVALQGESSASVSIIGSDNDTISEIENIVGTAGDDTISGDSADNTLEGRGGDDTLTGGQGADLLLGGDGEDTIVAGEGADVSDGGAGVDTVDYSGLATGQSISLALNGSTDATVTVTGGDDDTVRNVENLIATSGDDQVSGDAQANDIQGLAGDDIISASDGADTLDGGAGNDTLDYSALADIQRITVELDGSNATTVVVTGGSNDVVQNIENIIATQGNDSLNGDSQDNYFQGELGRDTLIGGAGDDVLDGGTGASVDTVSYSDSVSGVTVDLSAQIALDDGFGDVDTLIDIEGLIGSELDDSITSATDTQRIDAEGGDDNIVLNLGSVTVDGGSGNDTADYSGLAAVNAISVELDGLNTVTVLIARLDRPEPYRYRECAGWPG